jgi:oligogalacturonide lyase
MDYDGPEDIPKVGFVDKSGNIVREIELPFYCNHYHANIDNTVLVADAVNDIVLIDISTDTPKLQVLCTHNTSWRYQACHCHPTFSWSNDAILYASDCDREGQPQLYLVRLGDKKDK